MLSCNNGKLNINLWGNLYSMALIRFPKATKITLPVGLELTKQGSSVGMNALLNQNVQTFRKEFRS